MSVNITGDFFSLDEKHEWNLSVKDDSKSDKYF